MGDECHAVGMSRDGYQWAETAAAKTMAAALERTKVERGLSVRQLAKRLRYKQAVVLSHMANGKSPIPIDRAEDLARELDLDAKSFLRAVVEQRHPEVSWGLLADVSPTENGDGLAGELEAILGTSLEQLSSEQRRVMREVASEPKPERRWLSVHELPAYQRFLSESLSKEEVNEIVNELEAEDRLGVASERES